MERNMYTLNLEATPMPVLDGKIKVENDESNQHDFQDYLTDSLKKKDSEPGLPSNNSSRTFFEKSNPGSPMPSKSLSQHLLSADCIPPYISNGTHPYDFQPDAQQVQEQPYHVSPFNFNYDGTQEDYLRYRAGNYTNNPYDMSYMQHLSQLSSHWEDLNPQHCNIPIGKRRPRSIMISGENTEKLRKMYEQPLENYPSQEEKEVYTMPMAVSPGRYYYSNRPQYSEGMIGHELIKTEVDNMNGLIPDPVHSLNHSVFNYEGNNGAVVHAPDHICTANLSLDSCSNSHSHSIVSRSKSTKIPGKRQKHVRKACIHCKKAHLACDEARPCKRCVHLGKTDCIDVEHKRRGRPRSSPEKKRVSQISMSQDYLLCGTDSFVDGTVYSIEPQLNLSEIELDKAK